MDAVAARAATSKRSLYSHFGAKDALFLAVLDLIRDLYLSRLQTPEAYAADPVEATTLFCGRFQQLMTWQANVRTCRLVIAEAERVPASATRYFDAIFTTTAERLALYLATASEVDRTQCTALATDLLNQAALPRLVKTLLSVESPLGGTNPPDPSRLSTDVDLEPIRKIVTSHLARPIS
jgi:AcrR family transcriptional regulator